MSTRKYLVLSLCLVACIGCQKEKTTPELVSDLKGNNEGDKLKASRLLSGRKENAAEAIPALIEALKDKNAGADVHISAALGLGSFGAEAKDAIPALQAKLNDHDARVREAAAKALSRIDPSRFSPPTGKVGRKGK